MENMIILENIAVEFLCCFCVVFVLWVCCECVFSVTYALVIELSVSLGNRFIRGAFSEALLGYIKFSS